MPSEEDKYKGYREYFKKPNEWDPTEKLTEPLKEIPLMPSTIETIDQALYNWVNEDLNVYTTTNKGWKKVNLLWVANERAFQIKDNKDLRDKNGRLILPLMTVNRTSLIKDPSMKGVAWAHIPPKNDARGGAIMMARRINPDKTSNFANAQANKFTKGHDQTFPIDNKKVVYNTIYSPVPTYVVAEYELILHAEYQQQLNEMFEPFIVKTGQINNFFIHADGHKFEGFLKGDFSLDNNVSNLGEEERRYKTTISLKVLGYILGAGKNEERPKIAIRETAVDVQFPRERVIFGDLRPWLTPPKKK
tara:strand:+ start:3843 stop:4754 length:912 start_codon:yes stop_codon:yes gene_type:complete